jgi:hypothetical protein
VTDIRPTQKEIEASIDRIAMSPDGANLYIFLQRKLMKVIDPNSRGALRANLGERIFASELIGLMARGIAESVNRTSSSGSSGGAEQPVVLPTGKPVSTGGPRGAGRRITEHTHVPGWDRATGE